MKRFFVLLLMMSVCARSFASALPVSNVQNALSGIMQVAMRARGFAANDPRIAATLIASGATYATEAAGAAVVTAAGVTAPAWITTGLVLGIAAGLGYVVYLAADATIKWAVNSDGTVTAFVPADGSSSNLVNGAPAFSGSFQDKNGVNHRMYASSLQALTAAIQVPTGLLLDVCKAYGTGYPAGSGACYYNTSSGGQDVLTVSYSTDPYTNPSCGGTFDVQYNSSWAVTSQSCVANPPAQVVQKTESVAAAIGGLSSSDLAKPANPAVIAALANQAWQQAASQPGYAGLPYDATNPITAANASTWQSANPNNWPTVGDMVSPQAAPAGGTAGSPFSLPTSSTPVSSVDPNAPPGTGVNPGTGAEVNLGSDPGIGAPSLEATPTAQMILQPVLGLFPTLRSFVVPSHSSVCPTAAMTVFGRSLVMDQQCTLAESVRPTLFAVMAFIWACIALFIILRA